MDLITLQFDAHKSFQLQMSIPQNLCDAYSLFYEHFFKT